MNKILALIAFLILTQFSCKKPEGEGGSASIKGKVWIQKYNGTFSRLEAEYAGADEWVYIIYGNETSYGDRIRTNYNGEFEFRFLRKGNYKLYAYSKDSTFKSPSGIVAVVKEVEIKERKETVDAGQITIFD
ncbi:MAG: hypothetical protein MH472_00685 [Bacteroidia bacterium]|nr:hypothetical protein [Bacteroidia bacterium]